MLLSDSVQWPQAIVEHLFVGPVWPASILAAIVLALVFISLLGVFSFDFGIDGPGLDVDPGVDIDPGVDVDAGVDTSVDADGHHVGGDALGGIAAATMKAVHLDRVPLMVWLTVFSLFFWVLSFVLWFEFDVRRYPATFLSSALLTMRNGVMAVVLTRFMTTPLHRLLVPPTHYHAGTLVGGIAIVETSAVDDTFGRARYATNAAPLLIDIRTSGERIPKGTPVRIMSYDQEKKVYHVETEETAAVA
ncbi:OB-fold-containig protein [Aporhodopirellula aestuarii]|uniref:DUF1449 family protein n=1 Tax=Aporhodopirellula aestuarii TaxID=2950107 RepID=A0ABT0U3D1_9BACT|nr:OB-fold-containig protein [Aporhodopirellula aestuarii]MCM2371401.1 DUF1449 family protein [Aporhodopirellula aestuarii]